MDEGWGWWWNVCRRAHLASLYVTAGCHHLLQRIASVDDVVGVVVDEMNVTVVVLVVFIVNVVVVVVEEGWIDVIISDWSGVVEVGGGVVNVGIVMREVPLLRELIAGVVLHWNISRRRFGTCVGVVDVIVIVWWVVVVDVIGCEVVVVVSWKVVDVGWKVVVIVGCEVDVVVGCEVIVVGRKVVDIVDERMNGLHIVGDGWRIGC